MSKYSLKILKEKNVCTKKKNKFELVWSRNGPGEWLFAYDGEKTVTYLFAGPGNTFTERDWEGFQRAVREQY